MVLLVLRRAASAGLVRRHSRLQPLARASPSVRDPSVASSQLLLLAQIAPPSRGVASTAADSDRDGEMVYEAPLGRSVRLMKRVSLTSCLLTSVGMPTVTFLSEQSASVIGKWAMCGTIMLFGVGTTSLFHLLFKPYVMRMWLAPAPSDDGEDARVTVETLTLLAGITKSSFLLSDVARPEPSMHPMLSFQARGANYFIHPECIHDDELLKKLLGADFKRPARVEEAKDDDDDDA